MSHRIPLGILGLLTLVLLGMVSTRFITEQRAEAQSNQAPVILNPTTDITVREGDAVVIPFVVHEPDNDVVEYSVDRMIGDQVQPTLPTGAILETDKLTAEQRFIWWPNLSQEGLYVFRFTATDDEGLSAEKTVQVTVQERTGAPAIVNARATIPMTVQHPETRGPILPGETIVISEGKMFAIAFNLADPEAEAVTVTVNGLPEATVRQKGSDWVLNWITGTDHLNVGMHQAILTATDTQGNQSTLSFAVDVRRKFNGQAEAVEIHPYIQAGLVRASETRGDAEVVIIRGDVTLGVKGYRSWGSTPSSPEFPFPAGMRYRYVLHTPDGQGNDVKTYLSGVLTGQQSVAWDSGSISDGTYVIDIEIIELDPSDTIETTRERFYLPPLYIVVDNAVGSVTGPQWQATVGFVGMRSRWTRATAVDWVHFSGTPELPEAEPWPYEPIAPPQTDAERQALLANDVGNGGRWFVETWNQVHNARFSLEPTLARTREGHIVYGGWLTNRAEAPNRVWRYPGTDGARNQGSFVKQNTNFRPNPTGPGFIGISWAGRLFRVDSDGTITTLAGYFTRPDVVPYTPFDLTVTRQEFETNQWQLVGQFEGGVTFKLPRDIVFDPTDATKAYVADTGNHRIALVDLSGPQAVITTFAGRAGTAGYAEGSRLDARFNDPMSVEIVGRTLYVADMDNLRIRAINLDTGQVTTAVGGGPNAPVIPARITINSSNYDQYTWASVPFDQAAIVYPMWIRRYSNGDLAVSEATHGGTGNIRRIRFSEQIVEQVERGLGEPLDVDWRGNVGPVDSLLVVGQLDHNDLHGITRILPDGTMTLVAKDWDQPPINYSSESFGITSAGDSASYPVTVVIDDESPRFAYVGQYQSGLVVHRPLKATDPIDIDLNLSARGRDLYYLGTIPEFFGTGPGGSDNGRSSLAAIHGDRGHGWLGTATFDKMSRMTDAQLAAYIQAGMGGKIARPEITGKNLQALIYFIRVYSIQGKFEHIDPAQIATNLQTAGYWDNLTDTRLTEIRNVQTQSSAPGTVQISWLTDEPTAGLIYYGPTDNYGVSSDIEPSYSKVHAVALTNLTQDRRYHFRIRSMDQADNQTVHQSTFDVGNPPDDTTPPAISNVTAGSITETQATITWDTDELADSQVEYGTTTAYGSVTALNASLVLSHSQELTDLSASTLYHYRVKSKDASGNLAISADQTFTTAAPNANTAPSVNAGLDQTITLPASATLDGTVTDDGLPLPPSLTTLWSKVSGPGIVTFENAALVDTAASFSVAGTYVLRLTANDSVLSSQDDVQVTVNAPPGPQDLCLTVTSDVREKMQKDQALPKVTVSIREEGEAGGVIVLEKTYSSDALGKITIPEEDLGSVQDDGVKSFTIGAKIYGHLRTVLNGQKGFVGNAECTPMPKATFGDVNGDGRIAVEDLRAFIQFYLTQGDAGLLEIFEGKPPFWTIVHTIQGLGREEE